MSGLKNLKRFYDMGFHLIPLNQAKKPMIDEWKPYQGDKRAEWATISGWDNEFKPVMWAIICGDTVNRIVVVDFDDPHIWERYFNDVKTLTVRTPSGGVHLYLKSKIIPKKEQKYYGYALDIQGAKSYVVCPGSKNETGAYEIITDTQILEVEDALDFVTKRLPVNLKKKYEGDIEKFKKDVKKRLSISDYIAKHVTKVREGHGYWQGLCPFHSEKEPSFTVYEDNFYCFGCEEHGDIISFVMKSEGIEFKDALKKLSEITGVKLPEKGKGREEKEKVIFTSFIKLFEKALAEEIINNGAKFVVWNNEKVECFEEINHNGIIYKPLFNEAITTGAVLLPSDVLDYGTPQELIDTIQSHIHSYLDVSKDYEVFATWYILLSWLYDRVHTLPYLRAMGDTGCGKSRFLDVIGGLCYKPCMVSGAITPAPIYRMIRQWGGTIVLDEADFRDSSEKSEVITILNCGFEKKRPVIRCDQNNVDNLLFLPTYCPKVIATRYTFDDKALESRCLTEKMAQTDRKDIPRVLPVRFYEEQQYLRNKLLMFRFKHYYLIDGDAGQGLDFGDNIEPRLQQATMSFAALFSKIPELMERFKAFLEQYNRELIEERSESFDGMIVQSLIKLHEEGRQDISGKDIAVKMIDDFGLEKVTPQSVGKHLKSLKVETTGKRIENTFKRVVVWDNSHIEKLKNRYVSSPLSPPCNDTLDTNDTDSDSEKTEKQKSLGSVSSVSSVSSIVGESPQMIHTTELTLLIERCKSIFEHSWGAINSSNIGIFAFWLCDTYKPKWQYNSESGDYTPSMILPIVAKILKITPGGAPS